ncbi:hypothetical protein M446_6174 [Methylobacterium sp. 4-46]|uniref:hypothetical protein n=1 Tax=unclassified Methylobacterium TaxID=2615210 RepID=UPI000152D5AF|nr:MULTISPECIES: hypothetical protein [Methylobacterium]ACA20443.1 hypothetical protein M446_6174 [Methylobacterium sp. 4-46]WFT79613.1 hypothetical protein QA634_31160 [Methylobacterium nodulans]
MVEDEATLPKAQGPAATGIAFAVTTAGPDGVTLAVSFGPRTYPVRLSAAEAADLGLTLIATASVSADRDHPVPPGTAVENCFFPVLRWTAGRLAPEHPALSLTVAEGTEIAFAFSPDAARGCARDLARSARPSLRERLQRTLPALQQALPALRRASQELRQALPALRRGRAP